MQAQIEKFARLQNSLPPLDKNQNLDVKECVNYAGINLMIQHKKNSAKSLNELIKLRAKSRHVDSEQFSIQIDAENKFDKKIPDQINVIIAKTQEKLKKFENPFKEYKGKEEEPLTN